MLTHAGCCGLRHVRRRGLLLFPVEAQALADGRMLMHHDYGARVYSLSPPERRRLLCSHFAAACVQRVWSRHRHAHPPTHPLTHTPADALPSQQAQQAEEQQEATQSVFCLLEHVCNI
jgi:hypothetical protein